MEIGSILRQAREAKGLTLEQVEEETKIRLRYLAALEEENFALLPGRFFARSFLRTYARYLGLDAETLVARFEDLYPQEEEVPPILPTEANVKRGKSRFSLRLAFALLGLVGVFILFSWGAVQFSQQNGFQETPQSLPAQVSTPPPATGQPNSPLTQSDVQKVEGVNLVLKVVDESCWMRVDVDGRTAFTGEVPAQESKTFQAKERIWIKLGNAGVVRVQINGRDLGVLGERGQVVSREFLASNRG